MADALVVGISQSGRSPDIVAVVEEARRQGALTVALTNDTDSPLAETADHVIDLRAGPELATAATKTYTTELLAAALLSTALDPPTPGGDGRPGRPARPDRRTALTAEPHARDLAAAHAERQRAVVLGRGYSYPSAREWALKLQEMALVAAMPYSAADFEHGPLALAEPGLAGAGGGPERHRARRPGRPPDPPQGGPRGAPAGRSRTRRRRVRSTRGWPCRPASRRGWRRSSTSCPPSCMPIT